MKPAVLLIIAALLLPAYGQEKKTQRSPQTAQPTKIANPAPTSVTVVNQQFQESNRHEESYLSRLFSPENLPNIGLFIAGVIGIVLTVSTLRAINRQVEAQREALRARLAIGALESPFMDMIQGKIIILDVKLINTGGIPAYDVSVETWLEFLNIPFADSRPTLNTSPVQK